MTLENIVDKTKKGIKMGLLLTSLFYGGKIQFDYMSNLDQINEVNKYSGEVYKPGMVDYMLKDFNNHKNLYKILNLGKYLAIKKNQK